MLYAHPILEKLDYSREGSTTIIRHFLCSQSDLNLRWHKVNHGENNGMEEGICCSYDHGEVLCYVVLEIFSHAGYNSCDHNHNLDFHDADNKD